MLCKVHVYKSIIQTKVLKDGISLKIKKNTYSSVLHSHTVTKGQL